MKRFLENNECLISSLPEEFQDEFVSILSPKRVVGTLSESLEFPLNTSQASSLPLSYWCMDSGQNLPKYSSRGIFTHYQVEGLKQLYSELSGISQSEIEVPSAFIK